MFNVPKASDQVDQWYSVMFLYDSALKKVNTKIEVPNNEFVSRHDYNPIEHIKLKLKTIDSIAKELKKDGYEAFIESMVERLSDIAGICIICSFIPDIHQITEVMSPQGDMAVLHIEDYIKNPKPNDYRSCHTVMAVPVYLIDDPVETKVKIQIRSVAMNFWVSLKRKIVCKLEGNVPENLLKELKVCADIVDMPNTKMFPLNEIITAFAKERREDRNQEGMEKESQRTN